MLNSQTVKKMAKKFGADLVGISSLDRFEGAPKQNDPRYIFPQAKALIVLGYRIPRGTFRGIEEGTYFASYPSMGYAGINWVYGPMVLWNLTRYIEDQGYEAVPVPNINGGEAVNIFSGKFKMNWSVPVSPEKPYPDVLINFRIAAFCAGLGEIGHSRIFLTPEFGPFQRFNIVLTDAPLDPDRTLSKSPRALFLHIPGLSFSASPLLFIRFSHTNSQLLSTLLLPTFPSISLYYSFTF